MRCIHHLKNQQTTYSAFRIELVFQIAQARTHSPDKTQQIQFMYTHTPHICQSDMIKIKDKFQRLATWL